MQKTRSVVVQRFDETPTRGARVLQIWLILIGFASERKTITYGQLASRNTVPHTSPPVGRTEEPQQS